MSTERAPNHPSAADDDDGDGDDAEFHEAVALEPESQLRVRFHIIRNARIENVGTYQSCMVSKSRIVYMETDRSCQPWRQRLG